jgi:hypothetical protein
VLKAQVSSYVDNQLDGSISKRRVISFAPGQQLPERGVVTYANERWIIGDTLSDMWNGKLIRVSAATKKVTGLYSIKTAGEAALNSPGVQAYAQLIYLKDTVNTTVSSNYSPQYEVYFSSSEQAPQGRIIYTGDNYLHVRSSYPVLDGFVCAISDELGPAARRSVTLKTRGAYNTTTDSYATTVVNTHGILADFYKIYGHDTPLTYAQQPGDFTLLVAALAATPAVGENLTMDGIEWRIYGSVLEGDSYRLHIRRLG